MYSVIRVFSYSCIRLFRYSCIQLLCSLCLACIQHQHQLFMFGILCGSPHPLTAHAYTTTVCVSLFYSSLIYQTYPNFPYSAWLALRSDSLCATAGGPVRGPRGHSAHEWTLGGNIIYIYIYIRPEASALDHSAKKQYIYIYIYLFIYIYIHTYIYIYIYICITITSPAAKFLEQKTLFALNISCRRGEIQVAPLWIYI